jgi:hypothetical protein
MGQTRQLAKLNRAHGHVGTQVSDQPHPSPIPHRTITRPRAPLADTM